MRAPGIQISKLQRELFPRRREHYYYSNILTISTIDNRKICPKRITSGDIVKSINVQTDR